MELGQENPLLESGAGPYPKPGGPVGAGWGDVATISSCQDVTSKTQPVMGACFAKTPFLACLVPQELDFSGPLL